MEWLQALWQSAWVPWVIAGGIVLTLIPASWVDRARKAVAGVNLPNIGGPDTATDAAKIVIERKAANAARIAELKQEIARLEADDLKCNSLILKGEAA